MSNSEDSTVTYTEVSSLFEDLSDIGSPGVDGLPMMLEDPYREAALQAPPSLDYVPEDDVLPAEEQPLPAALSPTADSPGYITEFNPEEDPEEDDEDPEEDPADYPTDRDDGEEEEESSGDDADDEEEDKDEDEEKEHLAPADSIPPPIHRVMARISIRAQTPISLPSETEVAILLNIPTLPPSPLSPCSSPLPHIPSPPLPVSPPLPISPPPLPASPTYPLGYRAAMIRLRAELPSTSHLLSLPLPIVLPHTRASVAMMRVVAPSTYILVPRSGIQPSETQLSGTPPLLPIPLPTPSSPLLLPSTDCRAGVSKVILLPQKRLCITLGPRSVGVYLLPLLDLLEALEQTMDLLVLWMIRLGETLRERLLMSGQLNMLLRDRRAHAHTARLMETEARLSREDWVQSMDASDTTRSEVRSLRTTVLAQQAEIAGLRAANCT
ncbi:hypothetical protein Tco_1532242 [Tanacetum coccineum]